MSELCKVLIVDDELLVRQGVKHHLDWEKEGFELVGDAANGQEALTLIEQLRPHIVITDIVMPIMDGEELTRIIKQKYPTIEVIVLSSFSEFDYVKSSLQNGVVDYILKPRLESEELLQVLKKTASKIVTLKQSPLGENSNSLISYSLSKALVGYEVSENDFDAAETFPYPQFVLLGCELRKAVGLMERDKAIVKEEVSRSIRNALQGIQVVEYAISSDSNTWVHLINVNEEDLHPVKKQLQSTSDLYKQEYTFASFALSLPFAGYEQMAEVYKQQILKLFQYRYYFPARNWMVYSELPPLTGETPKFNLAMFMEEVKRGRHEQAFAALIEYAQAASSYYLTDVYEFKSLMSHIIFNITILLSQMEIENGGLEESKYVYFKAIDESTSAEETIQQLGMFLQETDIVIKQHEDNRGNSNMKRLLQYIQEHYAEALSLSEMAKQFHFNPSYLSTYFTANNKEGFNEYLNRIRIEKAVELLREKELAISEISCMVGYSDHSYFCKVFKKFMSLSPSKYRREHTR